MAGLIDQMAFVIEDRFFESGRSKDLEIAITLHRKALELTPKTLPSYPAMFTKLAKALEVRHDHFDRMEDLDLVIACHQTLLAICHQHSHPAEVSYLINLANVLGKRFNISRHEKDRDEIITLRRQVVSLTAPSSGVEHIEALRLLAQTLTIRFRLENHMVDLDEAIELRRSVLKLALLDADEDTDSITRVMHLSELAETIYPRFRISHSTEDMAELIGLYQQLLAQQQEPGQERDRNFSLLALLMNERFRLSGASEDLDEAISLQLQLLGFRAVSHPERYNTLINLGSFLRHQFEQQGDRKSLDEAAAFLREAIELVPVPHNSRPVALNNLSLVLRERFEEAGLDEDLHEAIELQREALSLLDPSAMDSRTSSLINLSATLWSQYELSTGTEEDLGAIISLLEEALTLLPDGHPHRASALGNLGNVVRVRFEKTKDRDDLSRAIELIQTSLSIKGVSGLDRCVTAMNLGIAFCQLFTISEDVSHLNDGVNAFRSAATATTGFVSKKFFSARLWAEYADRFNHTSALEAYRIAIELLPLLVAFDADLEHRQKRLLSRATRTDGLAVAAADCALDAGKIEEAVELLEEGRAIFWSQAMRLRSPIGDLEAVDPELAEKLRSVGRKLEAGSFGGVPLKGSDDKGRLTEHQESIRLRQLNSEWDGTLAQIRKLPGFENFLQPRRLSALQVCARDGPIVILCMTKANGNAIIMTKNGVKHLPLPKINLQVVEQMAEVMRLATSVGYSREAAHVSDMLKPRMEHLLNEAPEFRDVWGEDRYGRKRSSSPPKVLGLVLKVLWVKIVEPIVRFLGLGKSSSPSRIYWCPTGPLTTLPIHAAGIYEDPETATESICDYVVSSYIPTIGSLLDHQERPLESDAHTILAIIEPKSLPGALQELEKIEKRFASEPPGTLIKLGDKPSNPATVSEVLRHLPSASAVHFACHGKQYVGNPLESALLLDDGRLSLSMLMQVDVKNARLAFLCACQTATGEKEVPDESMHLVAALLFAGFQGVVGTMWSIADADGPKIADEFYGYLGSGNSEKAVRGKKSKLITGDAARALHHSVLKLRSEGVPLERWVPFIYLGI
ncbi:hypothetical protein GALMADRAFT_269334 [Galerina marginata CBS 339.88]|uniref:CHAT domain-containing protein n=1 Tax=Galerina marginata (strain CBS 339.88) TaxID=685588 RepID=A0A067SWQ3_GALM3|nr:hypothetical protein GALMADRAFT_269334 [Galerina marginata CBS 339.88]